MRNLCIMRCLMLIVILTLIGKKASSSQEEKEEEGGDVLSPLKEVDEKFEDCKPNQFYYEPRSSCRNCTDLVHLFHSYHEWLDQEVSSNSGDADRLTTTSASGSSNTTTTTIKYNKSAAIIRNNNNNANNNNNKLYTASNMKVKKGPSRFSADGEVLSRLISVNPQDQEYLEPTQDTGSNEYNSDLSSDILKQREKQTLKFVTRFIQSESIGNELLGLIEQCRQYQNVSACQMWSNICVLTMYSYSDIPTQYNTRDLSSSYSMITYQARKYQSHNSWQQCNQFSVTSICNGLREWSQLEKKSNLEVPNIYAVDELLISKVVGGSGLIVRLNQAIQLLAYKYSYDGKFIGIDQFGLDEMEKFCAISSDLRSRSQDTNHIRLGKTMQLECKFNLVQVDSTKVVKFYNETIFIDLYLGYQLNGALFLKPVPIMIKNLLYNGNLINRKYANDPSRWKLVHRFFFHTKLPLDSETILLYAKDVVLDLNFKRQEKGTLLSSILLTLDYEQVSLHNLTTSDNNGSSSIMSNFYTEVQIVQTLLDMLTLKKDLDLALTILSILSSIWSLLKCYNELQKIYGIVKLDLNSLIRFILISCDTIGNLIAIVTFLFITFLFVTFKIQSNVHVLTPNEELETVLVLNLQVSLLFKLIGLMYKFYITLNADIFFIDWEKPKMLTSAEILNHLSHYDKINKEDKLRSIGNSISTTNHSNHQVDNTNSSFSTQTSSFWRPYSVVNRWIQMQTLRRHNTTLQLILLVCIVHFLEVSNSSIAEFIQDPSRYHDTRNQFVPQLSLTFRLLIISAIYLLLSLIQITFKKLFYDSIVQDTIHEFIDLCSVANVSLFCMLYPRFGFYIHGRNANGFGDCGIAEMNALLEREERDLCSKRGLAPNCEQQSFIVILPRIINDHYRKLLYRKDLASFSQMNKHPSNTQANNTNLFASNNLIRSALNMSLAPLVASTSSSTSFSTNRAIIETIVARNKMINTFLTNFIGHVYKDIDYSIRDRRRFESFLSDGCNLLDDENSAARHGPLTGSGVGNLNSNLTRQATFCKDPTNSFTSLLWLGYEWDLILVELLSLLMLDLWLTQPLIITVSLIWILHHSFRKLYVSISRHNLIAKAMLDEKFLLR